MKLPIRFRIDSLAIIAVAIGCAAFAPIRTDAQVMPSTQQIQVDKSQPFRGKILTYKVKLSEGSAWTNLRPESWLVIDVIDGSTVAIRHSTNVLNALTSFSKWWDHPVTRSKACKVSLGETGKRLTGCLQGTTTGTGKAQRHLLVLPPGDTIHDYMFEIEWEENGVSHRALSGVPAGTKPASIRALPPG